MTHQLALFPDQPDPAALIAAIETVRARLPVDHAAAEIADIDRVYLPNLRRVAAGKAPLRRNGDAVASWLTGEDAWGLERYHRRAARGDVHWERIVGGHHGPQ